MLVGCIFSVFCFVCLLLVVLLYGGKVFVLNLKYCGDGHLQPDRTVFWVQIRPSI